MKKYTGVFQTGFDIAYKKDVTGEQIDKLQQEISNLIDSYEGMTCVNGCFNEEDMSHAYGEAEMREINKLK